MNAPSDILFDGDNSTPRQNAAGPGAGQSAIDPGYYLCLLLQYRWLLMALFCLSMAAGIYFALTLPREYESSTLILVEGQRVPKSYVQSIVSTDIGARISTISQQVKSRTNLLKIMKEFQLFVGPEYEKMYPEDKLKRLRSRIKVQVSHYRKSADSFSITFRWQDPQKAMQVTNALTSYFINENLKARESYAIGTKSFLDDELAKMKKKLESMEEALKDYRTKYMGELPEQLDSNLRMLDRLQANLSEKQQALRDMQYRLAFLDNQSETMLQTAPADTVQPETQHPTAATPLETLKRMLADMQLRYTDQHPDIIRLKKIIAAKEKQQGGAVAAGQVPAGGPEPVPLETGPAAKLKVMASSLKMQIAEKKAEIKKLQKEIDFYQKRVENTPKREQELFTIKRDYDNIQKSYNSMLARKLEADIAVNMEKQQKGEQFRIIDRAALPDKPVSPNMKVLFGLFVVGGMGSGIGFVLLMSFLDKSVRNPKAFERISNMPVLAAIPNVMHPRDIFLRRMNWALSAVGFMVSVSLLACFALVSIVNYEPVVRILSKYAPLG